MLPHVQLLYVCTYACSIRITQGKNEMTVSLPPFLPPLDPPACALPRVFVFSLVNVIQPWNRIATSPLCPSRRLPLLQARRQPSGNAASPGPAPKQPRHRRRPRHRWQQRPPTRRAAAARTSVSRRRKPACSPGRASFLLPLAPQLQPRLLLSSLLSMLPRRRRRLRRTSSFLPRALTGAGAGASASVGATMLLLLCVRIRIQQVRWLLFHVCRTRGEVGGDEVINSC